MLDLETTGGNPAYDRITEIAAVRLENGLEVARWCTLVNPGISIPPFIQQLTGITNSMVSEAPRFENIADELLSLLEGAVFVAHNVQFDYGFILSALQRMDIRLKIRTLCTVRLSRKLYPQHKGHGLDAIMQRHGLQSLARHRAMGDVDSVLKWLKLAQLELGVQRVQQAANALLQGSISQPPHLATPIEEVPDNPGVYLFFGEGPLPLYIGKSVHLRTRVKSHFQAASTATREMRILQEIRRIEWHETAGELGALLLESRLIKERHPVYNRQLRRERQLCAWKLADDVTHRPQVSLVRLDDIDLHSLGSVYGAYRTKRQALDALRLAAKNQRLCLQTLGLETGKGPCFSYQIGTCAGLCADQESPASHRSRLELALAHQRMQAWPYPGKVGLREYHPASGRTDLHIFEQWCHIATVHDETELAQACEARVALAFDLDTYRILVKRLSRLGAGGANIVDLTGKCASTSAKAMYG